MCGGTLRTCYLYPVGDGLSPRVRGNQSYEPASEQGGRSIPACAGEPGRATERLHTSRVYPRVCGGTGSSWWSMSWIVGLSPRVRGNLAQRKQDPLYWRSIPACAGEPPHCPVCRSRQRVYPRVCGGTVVVNLGGTGYEGLSPRVRGNPSCLSCCSSGSGSIPACAGEPSTPAWRCCVRWVYPRVCGGTYRARQVHAGSLGLSPRVRGNRLPLLHVPSNLRSIPACAGEP